MYVVDRYIVNNKKYSHEKTFVIFVNFSMVCIPLK